MSNAPILSALVLGVGLLAGSVVLSPSFAQDGRAGNWLSIPQVVERLEAAGYRNIEKIEREDGRYEARATNSAGERVKLYVNPQTGEIADKRDARRGRDRNHDRDTAQRTGDSADCTKRRCRDDLPQPANATPPAAN